MKKSNNNTKAVSYVRRTFKNKICALALIIIGLLTMSLENDATVLVMLSIFALPLFLSNKNHIC